MASTAAALIVPFAAIGIAQDSEDRAAIGIAGLGAVLVAPSVGLWYAHDYWTRGLAFRIAGVTLSSLPLAAIAMCSANREDGCEADPAVILGTALSLVVGLGTTLVGIALDLSDAADATRAYNRRHGWTVTPAAVQGARGVAPGLAISGGF